MREIIKEIIATESEARRIVETARADADRILSDAQKKGHDLVERARQETLIEAEKIVEAALEAARQEKQARLADAAAEIDDQIQFDPAEKKSAVEEVVRCVCKQP
jgi:vacuolar-type H+-ATPase subunit H